MKNILSGIFQRRADDPPAPGVPPAAFTESILDDESVERLKPALEAIDARQTGDRIQAAVKREIRSAAELSLKRLHVLQQGRCPLCSAALIQSMFMSVCDACGWCSYSVPRRGSVKVHTHSGQVVEGTRCFVLKDGVTIVMRGEIVFARIPSQAVEWVEYLWGEGEVEERSRSINERLLLQCGWCGKETSCEKEGFHLVQAAFGTTQERYCFCSDECYEAFRQMYPSRVHRNCYDRSCEGCTLCAKRYSDESQGLRTLAKDFIRISADSAGK
ncbi:MAG: hypothetical protein ACOX5G_06755 [Kiritimatiellia bacterium]